MSQAPVSRRAPFRWVLVLAGLVALLSSCGTIAFDRDWDAWEEPASEDPMVGRWEGDWESTENGHAGGLRCMLTPEEEGSYLVRFCATYGWFFTYTYDGRFYVSDRTGERVTFRGEEDLGAMFGGVYTYDGFVEGDRFESTYEAESGDRGVFRLERVEPAPASDSEDG